ncbi:MAG: cytosine permease [Bacteroidales bacterium]|nr:cytosine permease [Bacteroidales bacterium]MBQ6080912.1 cytosine permease [Bacteroidales bacterium]MBQ9529864.1 cytosine permease [Bacteroidales bacterium]
MKTNDVDYTGRVVPAAGRKSNLSMFMIMLGFTFFSASMWVGQQLAAGLNWWGFIWALLVGGLILAAYTGALGFIGAESGMSLDMLAQRSFGSKGSWLPSAMISFTQIGWFGVGLAMFAIPVAKQLLGLEVTPDHMPWQGYLLVAIAGILMTASAYFGIKSLTIISYIAVPLVAILGTVAMVMAVRQGDKGLIEQFAEGTKNLGVIAGAGLVVGSFVSGGTATPNFTRFAKSAKVGLWTTVIAFFLGNSLMFLFGAVSSIYVGGNDIFDVMLNLNLFYIAVLVLGLNIWTTNDNALYTGGLGLSNIFGKSKKAMVLISGIIGTVAAVWLYWNFCGWLNVLNCTLPPVGIILILSYFLHRKHYLDGTQPIKTVNWWAVLGVVAGAVVANLVKWGFPAINGMVVAAIFYLLSELLAKKK